MNPEDASFRALRTFNDPALHALCGRKHRISPVQDPLFPGDTLPHRLVRALGARHAIDIKEVFESFEMFERIRRRLRAPRVADLYCGHGLTGILFAVFEREVEEVRLVDARRPESHARVLDAVVEVAPWVARKVRFDERDAMDAAEWLAPGTSVVAVHACGQRTDHAITAAIAAGSPVAVMPCCYRRTGKAAPRALHRVLGGINATDTHRTYALIGAGYSVDWQAIPACVTRHNRIIVAVPGPSAEGGSVP